MIFEYFSNKRVFEAFFGCFYLRLGRGIFKNTRIPRFFVHKRHSGGVSSGENVALMRCFSVFVRGFCKLCAYLQFSFFVPIYTYFFINQKERDKEGGEKWNSGCAVLYIRHYLPTLFFLGCAVFSRSFRADHYQLFQLLTLKKQLMRGCAGLFAPTCLKIGKF